MLKINFEDYYLYDETSPTCLRWKTDRIVGRGYIKVKAGDVAGHLSGDGYYHVGLKVDGVNKKFKVHDIVFQIMVGGRTKGLYLDHINRIRVDNRVCNLREVTSQQNSHNLTQIKDYSIKGVYLSKRTYGDRWVAEWAELDGTRKTKSYSCNKYSSEVAENLAIADRKSAEARINLNGGMYNDI